MFNNQGKLSRASLGMFLPTSSNSLPLIFHVLSELQAGKGREKGREESAAGSDNSRAIKASQEDKNYPKLESARPWYFTLHYQLRCPESGMEIRVSSDSCCW